MLKRGVLLFLCINFVHAVASVEVSQGLNGLIEQINKVNDDIKNKQKQQQHLSRAITDSDAAIDKSAELLDRLESERDLDIEQLDAIEALLPQLTEATQSVQTNIKLALEKTYRQLRQLQANDSVVNGNDSLLYERKKKYLIKLLELEQQKGIQLQAKLDELNALNTKISAQLDKIDNKLGITTKHKSKLEKEKEAKQAQAKALKQNIAEEKQQLSNLKVQQEQLNKLLQSLQEMEVADNTHTNAKPVKSANLSKKDKQYEDNSPFLLRSLSKPVENGEVIVKFGEIRGNVANNGLLFKASNSPIHAISNGRVLYAGELPGFGQMLVIDNGDKYTSIYGGVLPKVSKNQRVTANQVIGSAGSTTNQPMGGIYFELRHLGKPVNPARLE
jgi:septal ring factor EnvC (AmiA/AmiB activator)